MHYIVSNVALDSKYIPPTMKYVHLVLLIRGSEMLMYY